MQQHILAALALALFHIGGVYGQSSASNGLNAFLSGALGAVTDVSSAKSAEATKTSSSASPTSSSTSSTPTSSQPSSTSTPSAAPAAGGLSTKSRNLIIILVLVLGVLLIGLIIFAICCFRRRSKRRRARSATPLAEDEFDTWRKSSPGREYSPVHQPGGAPSLHQQPTVPVMVAAPEMSHHSAGPHENPFVPIPPSPRRAVAPNSRSGLTDAAVPGDEPFVSPIRPQGRMRRSPNHSVSPARTPYNINTSEPFVTPVRPGEHRMRNSTEESIGSLYHPNLSPARSHPQSLQIQTPVSARRASSPHHSNIPGSAAAAIGNPYQDMHVHILQTGEPSRELRDSLQNREPLRRRTQTPPAVPSRSPHRTRFADSAYSSESSNSGTTTEEFRSTQTSPTPNPPPVPWNERGRYYSNSPARQPMAAAPWQPGQNAYSNIPRETTSTTTWETHETTYSNSPRQSMGARPWDALPSQNQHSHTPRPSTGSAPWTPRERSNSHGPVTPPASVPWMGGERERRPSMSPRQSAHNTPRHSAHTTPRQSMSGPSRRLRISDVQQENEGWENQRFSQGVGEAL
ncbi:hypothetical protein MMC16_004377 [Acarospora aff. strigata]|nr:hypothetical protein [Acarospora aff. strigata]